MNFRVALSFLCMVACGALAPPQLCLAHVVQEHVQDVNEAWVTMGSTVLHFGTFAIGFIVCKWLKGYPPSPVFRSGVKVFADAQISLGDLDVSNVVASTAAEDAFWDTPMRSQDFLEIGTVRGFGETAKNLAAIFKHELSDDEESIEYEFAQSSDKRAGSVSSEVFKHELTGSTTDGDYDDEGSDSDVFEVASAPRSPACSWGPPSPPSPSREASPLQGLRSEADFGASLSDVDVDSLLLLRGLEAALTSRMCAANRKAAVPPWRRSCFQGAEACDMSIFQCLSRVHRRFQCSNPCFVIALVYMDRVVASSGYLAVTEHTWNKLLVTSIVLALKFHDDDYRPYSNTFYAQNGGLDEAELNDLERRFCRSLDWKFFVQPNEYNQYYDLVYGAAASN